MLHVGLTGGIACGKSHVLRRLAEHGFRILELDAVGREVTAPGSPALAEIVEVFGAGMLSPTGALDRAALAARVFERPEELRRLNAIVHPKVRAAEAEWTASLRDVPDAVLVSEAALLVEAGAHLRFDRLIVVHCDPALQLARLQARDGLDKVAALARIEAQMPIGEKRTFAHLEIDSSGSLAETDAQTDALAARLSRAARSARPGGGWPVEPLVAGLVHGPHAGPRGLTPLRLLSAAKGEGGIELDSLARRLRPPARGSWWLAALEAAPEAPAAAWAIALAAWALRRGSEPPSLAAAAASLARLTHADLPSRTDACLLALLVHDAAGWNGAGTFGGRLGELGPLAERWGGARPTGRLAPVLASADRFPGDPIRARTDCEHAGGDGALAAGLAGLGAHPVSSRRARAYRELLLAVEASRA